MIRESEIEIKFYCDDEGFQKILKKFRSGSPCELDGHEGKWLVVSLDATPSREEESFDCYARYARIWSYWSQK